MSIDTENKRRSATGIHSLFTILPIADGSILIVDRVQVACLYSGLFESASLTASSISTTPFVGEPTISESSHPLSATGITTGSPIIGTPGVGQIHALSSVSISATPAIGTPGIGQAHALLSTSISTTPTIGTSDIRQLHGLDSISIITGAVIVGTPSIAEGSHALLAEELSTGNPTIGTPDIGQVHAITAISITTGSPILTQPIVDFIQTDLSVNYNITIDIAVKTISIDTNIKTITI